MGGFANDGSTSPGARVYVTNDGDNFKEVHRESSTGGESLMSARMLSTTEHWAGGTTKAGGLTAPLLALNSLRFTHYEWIKGSCPCEEPAPIVGKTLRRKFTTNREIAPSATTSQNLSL